MDLIQPNPYCLSPLSPPSFGAPGFPTCIVWWVYCGRNQFVGDYKLSRIVGIQHYLTSCHYLLKDEITNWITHDSWMFEAPVLPDRVRCRVGTLAIFVGTQLDSGEFPGHIKRWRSSKKIASAAREESRTAWWCELCVSPKTAAAPNPQSHVTTSPSQQPAVMRSRCREKDLENKLAFFEHKLQEYNDAVTACDQSRLGPETEIWMILGLLVVLRENLGKREKKCGKPWSQVLKL